MTIDGNSKIQNSCFYTSKVRCLGKQLKKIGRTSPKFFQRFILCNMGKFFIDSLTWFQILEVHRNRKNISILYVSLILSLVILFLIISLAKGLFQKWNLMGLFLAFYDSKGAYKCRWKSLKRILRHEKFESQTKSSFEILPLVNLITCEITFQHHFTNLCNLVKQEG